MVGCVIVVDGRIIGEGYHRKYGEAHAEADAINNVVKNFSNANELLKKATLYVNLEPCAHFGKRPPCADLIVLHQLNQVVIGCRDPFALVNGDGIARLKQAGILVIEDVLNAECRHFNRRFITRVEQQRPYIILKWAETRNGYFAPANETQKWITSAESRNLVHKWRSEEDAVLVGTKTALIDNPQLNVRLCPGRNPIRIIIDQNLTLPDSLHLFDQSQPTIVFNVIKTEISGSIKFLEVENFNELLIPLICYQLYLMDVQSVIVEGGAKTLKLFIDSALWDEARVFKSTDHWTTGIKAPVLPVNLHSKHPVGTDELQLFFNHSQK